MPYFRDAPIEMANLTLATNNILFAVITRLHNVQFATSKNVY